MIDLPQQDGVALRFGIIDLPSFYEGFDRGTNAIHCSFPKENSPLHKRRGVGAGIARE